MHAHGAVLRNQLFSPEQTAAIIRDPHHAGLEPAEVAMIDYVQTLARDANQVTDEQIQTLRDHGFSDQDILNITLVASARVFFSKVMDALGVETDPQMLELDEVIRAAIMEK